MNVRVKCHPTLGILVGTDGHVMVPSDKYHKAHWTYGSKHNTGYRTITYKGTEYPVHRLVLETFVGPCPDGFECDHINRKRDDNYVENLRWVSKTENQRNCKSNDRCKDRLGINYYDDPKEASRRSHALWYMQHKDDADFLEACRASYKKWSEEHKKTHRRVLCSDRVKWVPNKEALVLLQLPVKERIYAGE